MLDAYTSAWHRNCSNISICNRYQIQCKCDGECSNVFAWQWFHFILVYAADQDNQGDALPFLSFWMPVENEWKKGNSNCDDCKMRKSNSIYILCSIERNALCKWSAFLSNEMKRCFIFRKLDILTYQKEPKYLRFISKCTISSCLLFCFLLFCCCLTSDWHMCAQQQHKWNALQQIETDVSTSYRQHSNISFDVRGNMCVRARLLRFDYNLPYYLRFFHSKLVWMCRFCCKADSSINYCCYSHFRSFFILFFRNDWNIQNAF